MSPNLLQHCAILGGHWGVDCRWGSTRHSQGRQALLAVEHSVFGASLHSWWPQSENNTSVSNCELSRSAAHAPLLSAPSGANRLRTIVYCSLMDYCFPVQHQQLPTQYPCCLPCQAPWHCKFSPTLPRTLLAHHSVKQQQCMPVLIKAMLPCKLSVA